MLPFFLAIFCVLTWYRQKDSRQALAWAAIPFAGGPSSRFLLILWGFHDPKFFLQAYFGKLNNDWIAGGDVVAAPSMALKINLLLGRIAPDFLGIFPMFTTTGDIGKNFFLEGQPVIDHATLALFLCGPAGCLVRFRKPAYAFACGLVVPVPFSCAHHSAPFLCAAHHDDLTRNDVHRRNGLLDLVDLLAANIRSAWDTRWALACGMLFFAYYAKSNWNTYFVTINQDASYLAATQANFVNGIRAIAAEDAKSPVYMVSFRKPMVEDWFGPTSSAPWRVTRPFWTVFPIPLPKLIRLIS